MTIPEFKCLVFPSSETHRINNGWLYDFPAREYSPSDRIRPRFRSVRVLFTCLIKVTSYYCKECTIPTQRVCTFGICGMVCQSWVMGKVVQQQSEQLGAAEKLNIRLLENVSVFPSPAYNSIRRWYPIYSAIYIK